MPTKNDNRVTTIWRLRVPKTLVAKVKKLAEMQKRSVTKQAELLIEEAVNGKREASI